MTGQNPNRLPGFHKFAEGANLPGIEGHPVPRSDSQSPSHQEPRSPITPGLHRGAPSPANKWSSAPLAPAGYGSPPDNPYDGHHSQVQPHSSVGSPLQASFGSPQVHQHQPVGNHFNVPQPVSPLAPSGGYGFSPIGNPHSHEPQVAPQAQQQHSSFGSPPQAAFGDPQYLHRQQIRGQQSGQLQHEPVGSRSAPHAHGQPNYNQPSSPTVVSPGGYADTDQYGRQRIPFDLIKTYKSPWGSSQPNSPTSPISPRKVTEGYVAAQAGLIEVDEGKASTKAALARARNAKASRRSRAKRTERERVAREAQQQANQGSSSRGPPPAA